MPVTDNLVEGETEPVGVKGSLVEVSQNSILLYLLLAVHICGLEHQNLVVI